MAAVPRNRDGDDHEHREADQAPGVVDGDDAPDPLDEHALRAALTKRVLGCGWVCRCGHAAQQQGDRGLNAQQPQAAGDAKDRGGHDGKRDGEDRPAMRGQGAGRQRAAQEEGHHRQGGDREDVVERRDLDRQDVEPGLAHCDPAQKQDRDAGQAGATAQFIRQEPGEEQSAERHEEYR